MVHSTRNHEPRMRVVFYRTTTGNEPVREWLKALQPEDRKTVGDDLKTAQYGWPLGAPLYASWRPTYGKCVPGSRTELHASFLLLKVT